MTDGSISGCGILLVSISARTGTIVIDGAPYSERSAGNIDLGRRTKGDEETGSPSATLRDKRLAEQILAYEKEDG
jgi:hypothetical protein